MRINRLGFLLAVLFIPASATNGQQPAADSLTAIDVLLLPNQTMLKHAQAANARLRENYPAGFALDETHHPHITLLQRYVRTNDLDAVYAAVDRVLNRERPAGWELEATGYYYLNFDNLGLAGIVIRPTPELRRLQQEIIEAVAPFTEPIGTSAAYVTTPNSPKVNEPTLQYVEHFIPQRIGKNFNPHVTIGVGRLDFVQRMKAAPFPTFKFKVVGAAVFHLGNYGTAAKELWQWTATDVPSVATSNVGAPLSSWNDGPAKTSILNFVERVTKEGSPDFVPPAERIAVFDNDGCLWAEQPMYFQAFFIFDRITQLAPQHPEWKEKEPFASALKGDVQAALAGGNKTLLDMAVATHAGMTTEEFKNIVREWITTAKHPKTGKLYTEMVYLPMLELLAYLRASGFKTFIVSGGGIEFVRPWAEKVYGVPPEQVVGSSIKTKYEVRDGKPVIVRLPELNFIDDKAGKPVGIQQYIGRRPLMAFGNSDGDYEMLRWTTAGDGPRFGLIVHHTDAVREYAYDRHSAVGRLDRVLDEAPKWGWTVVDMKHDWKSIFPNE